MKSTYVGQGGLLTKHFVIPDVAKYVCIKTTHVHNYDILISNNMCLVNEEQAYGRSRHTIRAMKHIHSPESLKS